MYYSQFQAPPPKRPRTRSLATRIIVVVWLSMVAAGLCVFVAVVLNDSFLTQDQATTTTATLQPVPTLDAKAAQLARAIDAANSVVSQPPVKGHWSRTTIVIEVSQDNPYSDSSAINQGKRDIFYIEQALWQHNGFTAGAIKVDILTPLTDKYGHESIGPILTATLTSETAHQFVWQNLYPDTAWKAYDDTWTLPSIQQS